MKPYSLSFIFGIITVKHNLFMKTQKLNFDAFASNELSKNEKKSILGKGDATIQLTLGDISVILTTTTPTVPPGGISGGNGDAKIIG